MKSLIRWGATLGLVCSTFWVGTLGGAKSALALEDAQIVEKLQTVPVFTITDREGAPLILSVPDGDASIPITGVFIRFEDAQAFLEKVKTDQPELADQIQVTLLSLADTYTLGQEQEGQAEALNFQYIPDRAQVNTAQELLQASGQNVEQFPGVPLFLARAGDVPLTTQQGDERLVPVFFDENELQQELDRLKAETPELANTVTVEVLQLERLIEVMQTTDDPTMENLLLVPPQATLELLETLQPVDGSGAPPAPAAP
jgi:DNA-binding TFAR19-related protein (PDSD5 family)